MASTTATGYMAFNPMHRKKQAAAAAAAAAAGAVTSGKTLPLIPANKLAAIAEQQQDKQRRDAVTSDEDNDAVIGRAVAHTPVDYEDGDANGEYTSPPPQPSSQSSKTDAQKKLEEMLKNLTPEQKKALQLKKMANKAKQLQRQQPVAKPEPASATAVDAVSDTLQAPSAEFVAAANTMADAPPIAVSTNDDTMYVQMPAVVVTTAVQQETVVDVPLPPDTSVPVPMLATVSTLDHVDAPVAATAAPPPRSDLEAPFVPFTPLVPVNVVEPVAQKEVVVEEPPKATADVPKEEPKKKEEKTKEKKDKGKQKEKGKSKEKTKDKSKTKGKEKSKDKTKSKGKEKEKGKDKEKHTSKSKGKEKKRKANGKAFMDDAASEDGKEQSKREGFARSSSRSGVSEEEYEEEEEASEEDSANDIIDDGEIEVVSENAFLDKAERKIQRAARKLDSAIHSKLSTQTREEKYDNMMKSIIQKHVVKPAPTPVPTAVVVAPVQEVVAPKPDLVEKKPAWLRCLDDDYDDAGVVPTQVVAPATEAPATAERPQTDCDDASEGVSTDHMVTLMRGVIHSTQLLLNVTSMLFDQKYGKRKRDHASSDAVAAFIVEGGRNGGILSDLADELLQQPQSKKPRVL